MTLVMLKKQRRLYRLGSHFPGYVRVRTWNLAKNVNGKIKSKKTCYDEECGDRKRRRTIEDSKR